MSKSNYQLRILIVTCVAHALTHIFLTVFTPIGALMARDFELEYDDMTFFFFLCTLFFGLGALPSGFLSDRLGEWILLVAFFVGCAIGAVIVGLARDVWTLGAGFVLLGLATSIFHPVGNALITKGIAARGRALGINGIAGSVGTALGPLVAGPVADLTSWRWAFLGFAAVSLVIGVWLARNDLGPAARPVPRSGFATGERGSSTPRQVGADRVALFTFLLLAMTCGGVYFHLFNMALPSQFSEAGIETTRTGQSGVLAGIALLFGAVGQMVAGSLCDRYDERKLYVGALLAIAPTIYLVGQLAPGTVGLLAAASVASMVMATVQPIENSVLARFSPPAWRGRIFSLKFVLAFSVGASGNWLAGVIAKHLGLPRVFETAGAVAALALVCAIVARLLPLRAPPPTEAPA